MKTKNIDITFICLPPSLVAIPSAAFSVLKTYLNMNNIHSSIIYANHYLEKDVDYFKESQVSNTESYLPFISLYNKIEPSKTKYIKTYYKSFFPDYFLSDRTLDDEIEADIEAQYSMVVEKIIHDLKENHTKIVGFSSKFHQWIPALYMARRIKEQIPHIIFITGGWTHKKAAEDFLQLHSFFDYSIWGEGEIPLTLLIQHILNNNQIELSSIPRLVYHGYSGVASTHNGSPDTYIDFKDKNAPSDFSDYFESLRNLNLTDYVLPIERGRGCNWNKCSFCYLAQGYIFRLKPTESLITEILFLIKEYNSFNFFFTDNDVIGSDIEEFNHLLDQLIILKDKHPSFSIIMAEIISKDVDYNTIQKMSRAGFKHVQVGLESISEELLIDINKKQSIIDNFFFIKSAINEDIVIKGANIIIETPNETDDMIIESINNLHYYRFLLNKKMDFNITPLGVSNFSKYLHQIKKANQEGDWNISEFIQLIDDKYYKDIDRFSLMDFVIDKAEKPLWNLFGRVLNFYKRKKFTYKVKVKQNKDILYKEYSNKKLIKEILFNKPIYWYILNSLNYHVFSTDELLLSIIPFLSIDKKDLIHALQELEEEDLIFHDKLYGRYVSVIYIA